jgi:hypothetical protein
LILLFVILAALRVAGQLPDLDVLAKLVGIIYGGTGLMVGGGALILAFFADRRSKKAQATAQQAQASGRTADLELSGGSGDMTARQLLEKTVEYSGLSLDAANKARVAAQSAEVNSFQAADAARSADGKCQALGGQIESTNSMFKAEIARLDGRLDEQGHQITEFGAQASAALNLARALENKARRASDKALLDAAVEKAGGTPV